MYVWRRIVGMEEVIKMANWKLKSCPKCHGDLFVGQDFYGWYEQCLQCAHRSELKELAQLKKQPGRTANAMSKR